MRCACLVDTTRCIGCRSCQVACKQSNDLVGESTRFFAAPGGYQNPSKLSPRTFTYVGFYELEDRDQRPAWVFVKHQCMHCETLYCNSVCAAEVFHKTDTGIVAFEAEKCMGCAACVDACPFEVPAIDYWDLPTPYLRKCSFCLDRQQSKVEAPRVNGRPLEAGSAAEYEKALHTPACAKACPSGAIQFGPREALIAEARRRIAAAPDKYVDHVYGVTEAGGTGWLYLASVPFEKLGLPTRFETLDAEGPMERMGGKLPAGQRWAALWGGLGAVVGGLSWLFRRRDEVRQQAPHD